MQLSGEDREEIAEWIDEKCEQGMRCKCCGRQNWVVFEFCTISLGFDVRSTRFHYSQGLPQVPLICGHCGHILYFSPAVMGIEPEQPEEKDIPEAAPEVAAEAAPEDGESNNDDES